MSQVQNSIVRLAKSPTRRVYIDAGSNTFPTRLMFEVTLTDDGHAAELISGDVEALSDLESEEAELEAIRVAEAEWPVQS